ncbi:hypothetical protein GM240_05860 [Peribacillus butanolivorans]|nr:hypothetical protein [Peribacillus butanolivorans]QNU03510.1 hypothetical protein GM240_05860 [Peribacillus butanolivorans]
MAIPIKAIPVIKAVTDEIDRRNNPTMSSSNEYSKVHSIPIRFAINGAAGETKVKAISGIVVTIPATALLIPVSSRIRLINGPIDVIGARRLAAMNRIPITQITLIFALLSLIPMVFLIFPFLS